MNLVKQITPGCVFAVLIACMASSAAARDVVTADLSQRLGPATARASGFLHGIADATPADALVAPLRPGLFRMRVTPWQESGGAYACHARVAAMGAQLQIIVSDTQGCGRRGWWPNEDWPRWEALLEEMHEQVQERGMDVVWDIWNEPDLKVFWDPAAGEDETNRTLFFETWRRGVETLRRLDPEVVIAGPSNASFDTNLFTVETFLAFARAADVLPDILSWHEMRNPRHIPGRVERIRAWMRENDVGPLPISINEYVNRDQQQMPGMLVSYLAALEEADVASAAHACWPDNQGRSLCWMATLDGVLTGDTGKPTATWWVYRRYADITGERVQVTGNETVQGLAGRDDEQGRAVVLLGRDRPVEAAVPVEVRLANLPGDRVEAVVERIPHREWEALEAPLETMTAELEVVDGTATLTLGDMGAWDAHAIMLTWR